MSIVTQLWEVVSSVVSGMISALVSALSSLTVVFYETETGFTFIGVLLLMGIGVGLVYFVFRFVQNLVRG